MPKAKVAKKEERKLPNANDILLEHLKSTPNQFNTVSTEGVDYKVSMGSLTLDILTDGGLPCGIHRFMGYTEGGKTSEALEVMKNFLNTVPNGRGLFVKAEGRLSDDVKKRSGIEFFDDEQGVDKWRSGDGKKIKGNAYVYKNNVYDDIVRLIENLIETRDGTKYCIIIDSMDALNLQDDINKAKKNREKKAGESTENDKVAGAPLMSKLFFKRMSLPLTELGHMALLISQVSTPVSIGYSSEAPRKVSGTGGNAMMHFASWIFDYQPRFSDDIIKLNPSIKKTDPVNNPIIGHWAKAIVRKSSNEKSENLYKYPIKYGMVDGKSIWKSYEVVDEMIAWGLFEKKGGWFNFSEHALKKMEDGKLETDFVKMQGIDNLRNAFDQAPELADFWYGYLYDNMTLSAADSIAVEGDEIL